IRCKQRPSDYLAQLYVDTMGFWAPHVREAVEVFGVDRVVFGNDYGPVPIGPGEHIDIVNGLVISAGDKETVLWRGAGGLFSLDNLACGPLGQELQTKCGIVRSIGAAGGCSRRCCSH